MSAVDDGTAMTGRSVVFAPAVTACDRPPHLLLVTVNQDHLVVAVATIRRPIVAVTAGPPSSRDSRSPVSSAAGDGHPGYRSLYELPLELSLLSERLELAICWLKQTRLFTAKS